MQDDRSVQRDAQTPEHPPVVWVRRHNDDEWVDEVHIRTVPRFKESHLSGDEWRVSAVVEFKRKGHVVATESYRDVSAALAYIARHAVGLAPASFKGTDPYLTQRLDLDYCAQPGCSNPWTVEYHLTHEGCGRCGAVKEPKYHDQRRRFCDTHAVRGDSDLDDMDAHYVKVTP